MTIYTNVHELNINKYATLNDYIYNNILVHSEYVMYFLICLTSMHIIFNNFSKQSTKYALIHFFVNMYVTYGTFSDTVFILSNPYNIRFTSNYTSVIVVILHIYHIVFYREDIKRDELIHHIWIVFVILPITWLTYNNLANASLFFMTGFPGGITYFLIVLKDTGIISSLQEKYISKHLGMWIRMPGAIIIGYIIILHAIDAKSYLDILALIVCSAGCFWNGIYFASTIITSYANQKGRMMQ